MQSYVERLVGSLLDSAYCRRLIFALDLWVINEKLNCDSFEDYLRSAFGVMDEGTPCFHLVNERAYVIKDASGPRFFIALSHFRRSELKLLYNAVLGGELAAHERHETLVSKMVEYKYNGDIGAKINSRRLKMMLYQVILQRMVHCCKGNFILEGGVRSSLLKSIKDGL